ncbi:TetR/AcrR family transcriptional regulator [Nocardia sp. SSK8]|uniref:TetR/AcrR family transcriptional regulator n=1 Tax=Nocardia sp. SSK8 TaxID=3120154 RepID=UPI003008D4EE
MPGSRGESSTTSSPVAGSGRTAPRRTQQERTAQAERALLDAAAELIAQRGVDRTSLAEVGVRAGYSRGLVNHHFGSKAALLERLARDTQERFAATVTARITESHEDAVDTLTRMVHDYLTALVDYQAAARAFFVMWSGAIPGESALRSSFAANDELFRQGVEVILRDGQQSHTVDADLDPAAAALVIVGMLRGMGAQYLIGPEDFDLPAAIAAGERFVRRGVAPDERR